MNLHRPGLFLVQLYHFPSSSSPVCLCLSTRSPYSNAKGVRVLETAVGATLVRISIRDLVVDRDPH